MNVIQKNGQMIFKECRFCSKPLEDIKNLQCVRCGRIFFQRSIHTCNGKFFMPKTWKAIHPDFCCRDHEVIWYQIRRDLDEQYFLDGKNKREFTENELKTFQRIQDILKGNS